MRSECLSCAGHQLGSTYAGWNVPENSPLNVGMAPASWRNSYYAGDASTPWTMQFYDYEGSLNVPDVSPVDPTLNDYSGVGAGALYMIA